MFLMVPKEWGGKGLGRQTMKHEKGFGCFSCSQEWGGKGLGRLKVKHEKGFGCFSCSQEWGGKDLGRLKKKHVAKKSVSEKFMGEEPVG